MAIFFVFRNIAGDNSRIYFTKRANVDQGRRRIFVKTLSMRLMKEHIIFIRLLKTLKRYRSQENEDEATQTDIKREQCRLCKNSNTAVKCGKCARFVCENHSVSSITNVTICTSHLQIWAKCNPTTNYKLRLKCNCVIDYTLFSAIVNLGS